MDEKSKALALIGQDATPDDQSEAKHKEIKSRTKSPFRPGQMAKKAGKGGKAGGGGGEKQGQGDKDGSTELKDRLDAVGHAPLPLGHPLLVLTFSIL